MTATRNPDSAQLVEINKPHLPEIQKCTAPVAIVQNRAQALLKYHEELRKKGFEELTWYVTRARKHISIITTPDVFCPNIGEGSRLLADCIESGAKSLTHLDMGTGSGFHAVLSAAMGATVVAIDVEDTAVECCRENARRNSVGSKVDARKGDLFDCLDQSEKFDLITFNAPFMDGTPTSPVERAMFDPHHETLSRFLVGVRPHLAPAGRVLLAFSTAGDMDCLKQSISNSGLQTTMMIGFSEQQIEFMVYELQK